MTHLNIGDEAPQFDLIISAEDKVNPSSLRGKYTILYFYPKDDTPGCTIEANDFNELRHDFTKEGARVIGVSKDNLKSHDKFKQKYNLDFELGSDPDGQACEAFGVWKEKSMFGKKYMGINRATFLIDPEGKIAHIWPKVKVDGHARDVLAKLREVKS